VTAVLHLIVAALRSDADPAAVGQAEALATDLHTVPGVTGVVSARSSEVLLVAAMLDGRDRLEGFAASPQHMAFVMRGVAVITSSMWSASLATEAEPSALTVAAASATRAWIVALADNDSLFEWQARTFLDDLAALPGIAIGGVTVEEREQFRAGGLVLLDTATLPAFEAALAGARARWADLTPLLREASAPIVPGAPA